MNTKDNKISSILNLEYPDFSKLPQSVQQKFAELPVKVNVFRMLGHSPGAFNEIIDLTNALFKNLTLTDYHKELLILLVAAQTGSAYEWDQHVSISQSAGVRKEQFVAIAGEDLNNVKVFTEKEQHLLHFGKTLLNKNRVSAVVLKNTLDHFSIEELSDALIVLGFYRLLSGYIQTFNLPIDAQEDGNWTKK